MIGVLLVLGFMALISSIILYIEPLYDDEDIIEDFDML